MTDQFLIIEAFLDGDRVDADALKAALAREDGQDHLIQMLALREVVGGREAFPIAAAHHSPIGRWLAIAAVVALSVIGGYALGHQTGRASAPSVGGPNETAPTPSRVIEIKQWDRTNEGN